MLVKPNNNGRIVVRDREIESYQRRWQVSEIRAEEASGGRVVTLSGSSEAPVFKGWFYKYYETLVHEAGACNLERCNSGAASLLFNHNWDRFLGHIRKSWLQDRKTYYEVEFGDRGEADEYFYYFKNGLLRTTSIGYVINEVEITEKEKEPDDFRVTDWEVLELSLVTVPADTTVGGDRSLSSVDRTQEDPQGGLTENRELIVLESRSLDPLPPPAPPALTKPAEPMPEENPTTIQVSGDRNAIAQAERSRIRAIGKICQIHSIPDELRQRWENDETCSEEIAKARAFDYLQDNRQQDPVAGPVEPLGLSKREQNDYSVLRAIEVLRHGMNWKLAPYEKDVHDELAARLKQKGISLPGETGGGPLIPIRDLRIDMHLAQQALESSYMRSHLEMLYRQTGQRLQVTGDFGLGGALVETELDGARFIDLLRVRPRVLQAGGRIIESQGNLDIPKQLTDVQFCWGDEGQPSEESDLNFGLIRFRPKRLSAISAVTDLMLEQATPDIEQLVRASLLASSSIAIDRTALLGKGTENEPLGAFNLPGISGVEFGSDGGLPTWDKITELEGAVDAQNVEGDLTFFYNSRLRAKLKSTPKNSNGGDGYLLPDTRTPSDGFDTLSGCRGIRTNQIPNDGTKGGATELTKIIVGHWNHMMMVTFGAARILANPFGSGYRQGIIHYRLAQYIDIQFAHQNAFAAATDVRTK